MKSSTSNGSVNSRDCNANCEALQRSPSVISICSDGGIECTPPHKKIIMNLDDSMDYSPKVFDSSFSPTCMLSQTLAIDSPEVGWKWNRNTAAGRGAGGGCEENTSTHTPDSAYAADSSFASAGSSSTELKTKVRTRGERLAYDARREDQRKMLEQELRRVEKTRAEEKLKQRCAKLQEQLKSAGTQKSNATSQNTMVTSNSSGNKRSSSSISMDVEMKSQTSMTSTTTTTASTVKMKRPNSKKETLNDFFNDSDSDCFLLAATQEIESILDVKTQPAFIDLTKNSTRSTNSPANSISSPCDSLTHANSAPAATTTPTTSSANKKHETKEKRSSFYMKFLEDDCPDDWFVSLDDAILQATQSKKPRTSFQRYKSMPTETATIGAPAANIDCNTNIESTRLANISEHNASPTSSNLSRMKRHSSTHSLSPASSNCKFLVF